MTSAEIAAPNPLNRNRLVDEIVKAELSDVQARYGTAQRAGEIWLPYHNATHSKQVHDASYRIAQRMASKGKIDHHDVALVRIAAAFHDHEQLLGSGANERASAEAATAEMRRHPEFFSEKDISKVAEMILGTEVSFDAKGTMHQAAESMGTLAKIVADGDLAALGADFGPIMAMHLFIEMESKVGRVVLPGSSWELPRLDIDARSLMTFFGNQRRLLREHRYLTEEGHNEYSRGQQTNLRFNDRIARNFERNGNFGDVLAAASRQIDAHSTSMSVVTL